jgi:hypothetical protein
MTRDDIIRMAREQGCPETATDGVFLANADDLGRLLAADRERFASECIDLVAMYGGPVDLEAAIRARSQR